MPPPPAPPGPVDLAITFFDDRDLPRACALYERVLGLKPAIDQGWSRIYRIAGQAQGALD